MTREELEALVERWIRWVLAFPCRQCGGKVYLDEDEDEVRWEIEGIIKDVPPNDPDMPNPCPDLLLRWCCTTCDSVNRAMAERDKLGGRMH
jgi:hypothetical protein